MLKLAVLQLTEALHAPTAAGVVFQARIWRVVQLFYHVTLADFCGHHGSTERAILAVILFNLELLLP